MWQMVFAYVLVQGWIITSYVESLFYCSFDDTPLRPIVSSVGSVSYETAKELSRILKLLVGKTEHHVKNAKDFIDSIQDIRLKPNECLVSYDVEALFTSVPIQAALNITKKKLEEDKELHLRTSMSVQHISWLLEFCLRTTYFLFQGEFYLQLEGTAMGSPISPIIANLFLEDLEAKALSSSPHPHPCGKGMLMIPLPSSIGITKMPFWTT